MTDEATEVQTTAPVVASGAPVAATPPAPPVPAAPPLPSTTPLPSTGSGFLVVNRLEIDGDATVTIHEPGEVLTDVNLPASALPWLLSSGHIVHLDLLTSDVADALVAERRANYVAGKDAEAADAADPAGSIESIESIESPTTEGSDA